VAGGFGRPKPGRISVNFMEEPEREYAITKNKALTVNKYMQSSIIKRVKEYSREELMSRHIDI